MYLSEMKCQLAPESKTYTFIDIEQLTSGAHPCFTSLTGNKREELPKLMNNSPSRGRSNAIPMVTLLLPLPASVAVNIKKKTVV